MQYPLSLFIFRRDLRLHDNTALIAAEKMSQKVIPCFIFDKRQIEENVYKSDNALQFMAHSLQELDAELKTHGSKLHCFFGIAEEIIRELITATKAKAVFINRDYTPFSRARDAKIANYCQTQACDLHAFADLLLHEPHEVLKPNREPYTIYSAFLRRAAQLPIATPQKVTFSKLAEMTSATENHTILNKLLKQNNPLQLVKGGRKEALALLKAAANLQDYQHTRNYPAQAGTTKLSAHLKFGTLSIREAYATFLHYFPYDRTLINELFWRDFFSHISYHFPQVYGHAFHPRFNAIKWNQNENWFNAWREGRTGFPIVDAGMRELNATGYMHNRVRMITASFLVKDLHIDWQLGEKYFAQKLSDYDPALNNGNWQWSASTGCDAQPYFRIFNPWLQQKKFDPDCLYIKKWIPELASIAPAIIHQLYALEKPILTNYPHPIVEHGIQSQKAKTIYKMTSSS